MRKIIRKIIYITMGIGIIVAFSGISYAATIPWTGGEDSSVSTRDTTLNIEKPLKVYNGMVEKVSGPGIEYSYSVSPEDVGDMNELDGVPLRKGVSGGLTLTEVPTFPKNEVLKASPSGKNNISHIVLTVDLSKFSVPGIYRYKLLDETTEHDFETAGVTRESDYATERFVDVYIETVDSDLMVYGYTVLDDNDSKGTFDPDAFVTYNATLKKEVKGSLGDRGHQFPFDITLTDNDRDYYAKKGMTPTESDRQEGSVTSLSTTLSNGETYYICGLSEDAKVSYTETNNTTETYKVSINDGDAEIISQGQSKSMAETPVLSAQDTVFTNKLDSSVPTGVLMRYGILLAVFGFILMVIYKRSRKGGFLWKK